MTSVFGFHPAEKRIRTGLLKKNTSPLAVRPLTFLAWKTGEGAGHDVNLEGHQHKSLACDGQLSMLAKASSLNVT